MNIQETAIRVLRTIRQYSGLTFAQIANHLNVDAFELELALDFLGADVRTYSVVNGTEIYECYTLN